MQEFEELQREVQRQDAIINLVLEVLESWAESEGMSLISSQQLYCPSTERNKNVRVLLQHIRELG